MAHRVLLSALCSLLSALCSLLSALCSLLSALCSLPQDPVNRFSKVMRCEIGIIHMLRPDIPWIIMGESGLHEDGPETGPMAQFHIAPFVAYHEGRRAVDVKILYCPVDKACFRLSAVAGLCIGGIARRGMMRAVILSVDDRAFPAELCAQKGVRLLDLGLRKISARNAGLVCDHDDLEACFIELSDRGSSPGDQAQHGQVTQIADFLVDRPVSV